MIRCARRTAQIEKGIVAAGGRPVAAGTHGEWSAIRWSFSKPKGGRVVFAIPHGVAGWQVTSFTRDGYKPIATVLTNTEGLKAAVRAVATIRKLRSGGVVDLTTVASRREAA